MKCNLSSPLMFSLGLVKAMVEELIVKVNPLLSTPGGYLFRTHFRGGGLNRDGAFCERGATI